MASWVLGKSTLTKYIGLTGKLGGRISSEIQRELILNFFDYNLISKDKSKDRNLTRVVEKYEVTKFIKTDQKK